jgi:hypothetical protein
MRSSSAILPCEPQLATVPVTKPILDVTKAEGEPEIEPDRLVNDLSREPISGVADFFVMPFGYAAFKAPASCQRRDNAVGGYAKTQRANPYSCADGDFLRFFLLCEATGLENWGALDPPEFSHSPGRGSPVRCALAEWPLFSALPPLSRAPNV